MLTIREQLEAREDDYLAPQAAHSARSRGRLRDEAPDPIRPVFQRDRDRVIHSKAFRRLKHKTQVFFAPTGDHYRTRLTHTLEVSQIARTIAKVLRLHEELTEAIALGHDLGHPPFGHAGERVIDSLVPGGFSHYEQSLRIVDVLDPATQFAHDAEESEIVVRRADGVVRVRRELDHVTEVVEAPLPALVSVTDQANDPRYPSFAGIMAARKAGVDVWSLVDLGLDAAAVGDAGARTRVLEAVPRPTREDRVLLTDAGDAGVRLAAFLEENGLLENARTQGGRLRNDLQLAAEGTLVTQVRGRGLLVGVQLAEPVARDVALALARRGRPGAFVGPEAVRRSSNNQCRSSKGQTRRPIR